jgi:biopolymer transport protein ExbB
MSLALVEMIIDRGVLGLLALLGFVTLFITFERILFFRGVVLGEYESIKRLELDLTKHLGTLATIGSNAPYIGLLGTVLAIILTFYTMGESGGVLNPAEMMTHLSLALKATALGLMVAIPTTIFYNLLIGKVERLLLEWEIEQEGANREALNEA